MRALIYLYPPGWRRRYGGEVAELTAELVRAGDLTRRRAALDLIAGAGLAWTRALGRPSPVSLAVRNVLFTIVVPGLGGAWMPWWLLTRHGPAVGPVAWEAVPVVGAGLALYCWCVWTFATVGRGTPGPWDAPSRFVAAGPYRWVRNPIYVAALLVVLGQAWLFGSLAVLAYAVAMAVTFHIYVISYEERTLRHRFGRAYQEYRRAVPRWLVRPPARGQAG